MRQIIHTYVRVTYVQICVGKDTCVAWRTGEAEKTGSEVTGGYFRGYTACTCILSKHIRGAGNQQ